MLFLLPTYLLSGIPLSPKLPATSFLDSSFGETQNKRRGIWIDRSCLLEKIINLPDANCCSVFLALFPNAPKSGSPRLCFAFSTSSLCIQIDKCPCTLFLTHPYLMHQYLMFPLISLLAMLVSAAQNCQSTKQPNFSLISQKIDSFMNCLFTYAP